MDDDFSDLEEQSCEDLGMHGYCFLACSVLLELHPKAEIWRLHSCDSDYGHVFLKVEGRPLDIRGFRTVEEMMGDLGGTEMVEETADWKNVLAYFNHPGFSTRAERDYVRARLKNCVCENLQKYS